MAENTNTLDPRLTPARPDLAAAHLRGRVDAARFVDGVVRACLLYPSDAADEG